MKVVRAINVVKGQEGSAYIFVLMAALILFLLIGVAINVTTQSRNISARYIQFAGLYDLALAGNERILFLLKQTVSVEEIVLAAKNRIHDIDIEELENYLTYIDGEFFISGKFMRLLREEKNNAVSNLLQDTDFFRRSQRRYYFSYSLTLDTGTYEVRTYVWRSIHNLRVRSTARKITGEIQTAPTIVYGDIEWASLVTHSTRFVPIVEEGEDGVQEVVGFYLEVGCLEEFVPRLSGVQRN